MVLHGWFNLSFNGFVHWSCLSLFVLPTYQAAFCLHNRCFNARFNIIRVGPKGSCFWWKQIYVQTDLPTAPSMRFSDRDDIFRVLIKCRWGDRTCLRQKKLVFILKNREYSEKKEYYSLKSDNILKNQYSGWFQSKIVTESL